MHKRFRTGLHIALTLILACSATLVTAQDGPVYDLKKLRNLLRAIEDQEAILAKYPDSEFAPTVMLQLSELYVKRAVVKYQQEMAMYEEALEKYDAGLLKSEPTIPRINLSEAIRMCYRFLETYPSHPMRDQALYRIALCHLEEGNKAKAKDFFQQLTQETEKRELLEEAYFRLGEYYFDERQYEGAIDSYEQLLNSWDSPYFNMALYKLGWSYYNLERYSEAVSTFIYLIEDLDLLDQSEVAGLGKTRADLGQEALEYVAICFAEFGGPRRAKQFLIDHKEKPYSKKIILHLARLYQDRNFYNDAVESLKVLLEMYPMSPEAPEYQQKIVKNYELAGDRQKANEARALLVAKYGPGSRWLRQVKEPEVRDHVLSLVEDNLFALGTDAQAQAQASNSRSHYELAVGRYRSYLDQFPDYERAHKVQFYLGECLFDLERYEQAAEAYQELLTHYPESEYREIAAYHRILAYNELLQDPLAADPTQVFFADFLGRQDASADTFVVANRQQARFLTACNDFCRLFPESERLPEVLMKYGESLYNLNQYTMATATYRTVAEHPGALAYQPRAYVMMAQSAFKQGHYEQAEDWFARLAQLYPDSARYVERANKMIASSRFKVAESFREHGDLGRAAREFEKIARIAPDSMVAQRALFEAASQFEALDEKEKAVELYEALFRRHPTSNLADESLIRAGVLCEELKAWERAATNYLNVHRAFPESQFAARGLFNAARCYENDDQPDLARQYYGIYTRTYREDPEQFMQAAFRKGESAQANGNPAEALQDFRFVVNAYERFVAEGETVDPYIPAHAQFLIGEILFDRYAKIELTPPLERNLNRKKQEFEEVIKAYTQAARYKVADWTTASSYKIGATFEEFANFFLESPPPDDLTPEALEEYNAKLQAKILPFKKKALETYEANVRNAFKNDIENTWVAESRERMKSLTAELGLPSTDIEQQSGS